MVTLAPPTAAKYLPGFLNGGKLCRCQWWKSDSDMCSDRGALLLMDSQADHA